MSSNRIRSKLQIVIGLFFGLALLNFALLMVIIRVQGGSALNGKVENGRYYLGDGGYYTEVTQPVYSSRRTYETGSVVAFLVTVVTNIAYAALKSNAASNSTTPIETRHDHRSDSS